MSRGKVVIVDDELDVVTFLETTLVDCGFEIHSANSGEQGLELIRKYSPELVCLDILMPIRTGLFLYRVMRSTPELRQIPVLIISGLEMETDMATYLEGLPAPDGYLEKPVNPDVLVETVEALIERQSPI